MPKSENQRLKILYIHDLLMCRTDEYHTLTTAEIIEELDLCGVLAERKSIYSDIKLLSEQYNMEIMTRREHPKGYYVMDRIFELAEVKLLVDLVEASKFISEKKSRKLIGKLEHLTSDYQAKELHREVIVANRVKSANEDIYYDVDVIQEAIANNKRISFCYLVWNEHKELVKKRNERYCVSPWKLTWSEENYYLVAYDDRDQMIKYYRVDKMEASHVEETLRVGKDEFKKLDMTKLAKGTFGMYAGEERKIALVIEKSLIGVLVDRFGQDVCIMKNDSGQSEAKLSVQVSDQFYGWVAGLGSKVKIVGPQDICNQYQSYLKRIIELYDQDNG